MWLPQPLHVTLPQREHIAGLHIPNLQSVGDFRINIPRGVSCV